MKRGREYNESVRIKILTENYINADNKSGTNKAS